MGKNNKQTTSFIRKKNFDIPTGLVAQRRAELIAAREQSRLKEMASIDTDNLNPKPLSHLTKSRPQIGHKKPSRRRKTSESTSDFFKQNEQISSKVREIKVPVDWLNALKTTISDAWVAYNNYYKLGINTRQANGWFSWWRHTEDGQKRAERINKEAQASDDPHKIMEQLGLFFEAPFTRYENHSFATYLFEEFNKLLERHEQKPRESVVFDNNYWHKISEQLHLLMAKEDYHHNSETPVL
ncbi:hypothetical protein [Legionella sp. PC997]|uniref:hypothetical protein n=1 Tax=Legionella sp. PC997 TaxID=2755562 RepID=UPI0015F7F447|nr:hypothetical protein [Legionella sp. PC997]QMT59478.1 hypothetical protein HBNCFIEN_00844 [Legionella sp. PC997]